MVRSYSIDEALVTRAVKASGDQPIDQVLTEALQEYTHRRVPASSPSLAPPSPIPTAASQSVFADAIKSTGNADPRQLIALFGTIDYLPDYDPIAERKRQMRQQYNEIEDSEGFTPPR